MQILPDLHKQYREFSIWHDDENPHEPQSHWSGEEKKVLMCAFKQRQIVAVKQAVKELDPDAFLIVCDAHEVLGLGFRRYQKNDI